MSNQSVLLSIVTARRNGFSFTDAYMQSSAGAPFGILPRELDMALHFADGCGAFGR